MSILNFVIGVATGILSGMGIGGGSLLILYLTAVLNIPQRTAGGINLLYFIGCAPTALLGHTKNKQIAWKTASYCIIAGLLTTIPTSILAKHIDSDLLRRLFGFILLYVGIKEWRIGTRQQNK